MGNGNRLDPIHAVASMALALVEIQKDLGVLHRQFVQLSDTVVKMDGALISKFAGVDKALAFCLAELKKEIPDEPDSQGKKDNDLNEEDLRAKKGEAGVLLDDSGEKAQGGGGGDSKEK